MPPSPPSPEKMEIDIPSEENLNQKSEVTFAGKLIILLSLFLRP